MSTAVSRTILFAAGFALWAAFSIVARAGGLAIREAWDGALYWQLGVPVLFAVQAGIGALSRERAKTQPLWTLAGHFAAMLPVHPAGTDLGLLPLAILFIGVPGYGALLLAALAGRRLGPRTA